MIVCTTIDEDGCVTVSIDTDGDQGDGYSTDLTDDIVTRAGRECLRLWLGTRASDEPLADE